MKFILVVLLLISNNLYANCNFKTPNDLLEQIKSNHPQIFVNASKVDSFKSSIEQAGQRPNPELEAESTTSDTSEGKISKTSVSIEHVFELGGKRDARINVAQTEFEASKAALKMQDEDILIDVVKKLYRLRQVFELIPLHEESFETLNRIFLAKKKRRNLSPEEQVEKESLELVLNHHKLEIDELVYEKTYLKRHLSFFAGKKCDVSIDDLPMTLNFDKKLFKISNVNDYSKLKAAKLGVDFAKSKLELEKAMSYPNLSIGPVYEYEKSDSEKNHAVGISLTMDLPILSSNSGGKNRAAKEVIVASRTYKSIEREMALDLESWVQKFNRLKKSLKRVTSKKRLDKKHHKIDALFKRGVISTALVIEAHRQLMEFTVSRFKFELGAVEALWNIYKLNGSIRTKKLN
ncbi:MAG: TolC family protein [Bdellovibrionales bacterium]|nr:TolC family protein [Bdellovibrionales bacterium]